MHATTFRDEVVAARVEPVEASAKLVWSEYLFLLATAAAAIGAASMPEWIMRTDAALKHLPLFLVGLPLMLSLAGRSLDGHSERARVGTIIGAAWPFLFLALYIVAGSLLVRFSDGVQSTFLNVGLYMLMVVAGAVIVARSPSPVRLVRAHASLLMAAALAMSVVLIAHGGRRDVYHEQIFLVIPMAVLAYLTLQRPMLRASAVAFFLALTVVSAKNTSYMIALLVAGYIGLLMAARNLSGAAPLRRICGAYLSAVLVLIVAGGLAYLMYHRDQYLPSGNVEYRAHTYANAWHRFLGSPWFGTGFRAESVEKFKLYSIGIARNRLPTHSDVLDLLANGGVLAIGLWLIGHVRVVRRAWRYVLATKFIDQPWAGAAHTLMAIVLCGILTYGFNPILLQPPMAYLLWISLGMLLGLSLAPSVVRLSGDRGREGHSYVE
ncbi:MAG TPA: O-antigen ligase family protein [Steroidobacteraceae bacterium]|nr:O-antigen ligase family protein [Steroidobacteraceae bacterium]